MKRNQDKIMRETTIYKTTKFGLDLIQQISWGMWICIESNSIISRLTKLSAH